MKFLDRPPRFLFFTGKGGVGKTSIACTTEIAAFDEFTAYLVDSSLHAEYERIFNNSIAAAAPSSALLRQRAGAELREIDAVATRHARRYAVVPMMSIEPVGVSALLKLASGHGPITHGA